MDGLLSKSNPSNEVLKQFGNRIHGIWNSSRPQLYMSWFRDINVDHETSSSCWFDYLPLIQLAVLEGNFNIKKIFVR